MWRPVATRCVRTAAAIASEHGLAARACSVTHLDSILVSFINNRQPHAANSWISHRAPARGFAAAADDDDEEPEVLEVGNDNVRRLAEEIMQLSLLDVSDLTEILSKRLKIPLGGMGGHMMAAPATAAPAATAAAPAEAAAPPKTEFDIKLTGFDAAAKVKVIKEVRTMTSLGLKEAKEMVEKSPVVIKSGVKKEEAEELKKKLEAVGGKVSLE